MIKKYVILIFMKNRDCITPMINTILKLKFYYFIFNFMFTKNVIAITKIKFFLALYKIIQML